MIRTTYTDTELVPRGQPQNLTPLPGSQGVTLRSNWFYPFTRVPAPCNLDNGASKAQLPSVLWR